MAGFATPTHLLLIGLALLIFFATRKQGARDSHAAGSALARRLRRDRLQGPVRWQVTHGQQDRRSVLRLLRPTFRQAQLLWLIASGGIAFALTHAVAVPLFLALFFILWLCGYGALIRLYR